MIEQISGGQCFSLQPSISETNGKITFKNKKNLN